MFLRHVCFFQLCIWCGRFGNATAGMFARVADFGPEGWTAGVGPPTAYPLSHTGGGFVSALANYLPILANVEVNVELPFYTTS